MAGRGDNTPTGRQPYGKSTTEPSPYKPDHNYGHENRTGDPMRLTEENAYHYKTMVSSNNPIAERSFLGPDGNIAGVTRSYEGDVNGQRGGAYVGDRGSGQRINTTFTPEDSGGA